MSYLSLQKSVRTCRVDTGFADKIYSERFLSACDVVCPVWSGVDMYGRAVSPDTMNLEVAGCRSALDRVDVESYHRPQYFNFVNLDGFGVHGNLHAEDSGSRTSDLRGLQTIVGNPGLQFGAAITTRAGRDSYREFSDGAVQ